MFILSMGLNYRTAPLALRESLTISEEKQSYALERFGQGKNVATNYPAELVILSTCNRTEVYALSQTEDFKALEVWLAELSGLSRNKFKNIVYRLRGSIAVQHLYRVAAGLESMLLGETQILGQVSEAHKRAQDAGSVGPVLSRLFQTAIHTGKRARSETAIAQNPISVSSVAVRMALKIHGEVSTARALVIGAGEMAELAVEAFRKRGVTDISVLNRTIERAQELAYRWGARAHSFEVLEDELRLADIVISSTATPEIILSREMVAAILNDERDRQLVIIDIAIPRDVDPIVGEMDGVRLYDIDQLQGHLSAGLDIRTREVPRVEELIEEELQGFQSWFDTLAVTPLIAAIHEQAEKIRVGVVERSLRRLPDLAKAERKQIEVLSRVLVKKLINIPTLSLKEQVHSDELALYTIVTRMLFGLEQQPPETQISQTHIENAQPSRDGKKL